MFKIKTWLTWLMVLIVPKLFAATPITVTATITDAICAAHNGAITLTITGGTAPYTVQWDTTNLDTIHQVIFGPQTPSNPYYGFFNYHTYYTDGVEAKTLNLVRGITYKFNITAYGHPWYITNDSAGANLGALVNSGQSNAPNDAGVITFIPNSSHPPVLYYGCTAHPYMGYHINISNGYAVKDLNGVAAGTYRAVISDATGATTTVKYIVKAVAGTADFNKNGVVNTDDFLSLVGVFNTSCSCPQDINKNGVVNNSDFLLLLGQFNNSCTP